MTRAPSAPSIVSAGSQSWRDRLWGGRFESPVGFVTGVSLMATGSACGVAAILGLTDGTRDVAMLALMSGIWAGLGITLLHLCRVPRRLRSSAAFVGMLTAWTALVASAMVTYVVLGTFDHLDDALFESVSGFTTTATSVVPDPEALSHGVLAFRALTQWLGGLGALVFVVALLPSIGVGGIEVTDTGGTGMASGTSLRSRRTRATVARLGWVYAALTGVGCVLFFVGGMGPFDAITYATTTISTGGFANHAGSFGHFGSATIEWAGIGGMFLGGANLALLYGTVRGTIRGSIFQSFELRAYVTVVLGGAAVVAVTTLPPGGLSHDSIRSALFHVASAASTTGHYTTGWADWAIGPQVLLLAIMGVGAMSGSSGGGFRLVRALTLVSYLRRELVTQLHPRAIVPVRVGRRPVADEIVSRMIGYQAQYLLLAATGAVLVTVCGADLVSGMSVAVSAIANVGPALGDLAPVGGRITSLPRPARAALLPLMFLGRLEIAPVLVGFAIAGSSIRERLPRVRRH